LKRVLKTASFKIATEYLRKCKFLDARKAYREVIRNFPSSTYAASASLRNILIDITYYSILKVIAEHSESRSKYCYKESLKHCDDVFIKLLISFASWAAGQAKIMHNYRREWILKLFWDYNIFKSNYLLNFPNRIWRFPNVSKEESFSSSENMLFWFKIGYNRGVNAIFTDKGYYLSPFKLRLMIAVCCYEVEELVKEGDIALREILALARGKKYMKLRTKAKKLINNRATLISEEVTRIDRLLKKYKKVL